MEREEAWKLIQAKVKNKNLKKHMLATEAIMIDLALRFGEDKEKWGLTGLLHDIDYEETSSKPTQHGIVGAALLEEKGVEGDITQAIKAHAGHSPTKTLLDKALYAVDPLTGLIVACALIHPDKKLNSIDTKFVMKRFKEKRFAAGANRDQIKTCNQLNFTLEEFIDIGLKAMQKIADKLGL
ncbi:HDIG domain-containing protein [Candidatus Aerophobetes bacterium]|nr:HDIG domain-containing protein [Candidatus Aerophobetes bacterium]